MMRNKKENILQDKEYIAGCVRVKGSDKVLIYTNGLADYVVLTDEQGHSWGACSNYAEPFDFKTHIFRLPEGVMDRPVKVSYVKRFRPENYALKETAFTIVYPEQVQVLDREDFIRDTDHHIVPVKVEEGVICDGVTYKQLDCENEEKKPVKMFALFVDPEKAYLATGTAEDGYTGWEKIQTVKEMAQAAVKNGKEVVAATNADFFDMFAIKSPFMPSGICIKDGRALANGTTIRTFLGMDRDGQGVISSFAEEPERMGQLSCALGGREIFLREGELAELSEGEAFSFVCHPRTCAGIRPDGTIILLVVDGRIPEYSNGASIVDLARIMQSFGAVKAINLDGGGSSTFLIRKDEEFLMLNRPADLQRPTEPLIREVFNSILVVKK